MTIDYTHNTRCATYTTKSVRLKYTLYSHDITSQDYEQALLHNITIYIQCICSPSVTRKNELKLILQLIIELLESDGCKQVHFI